MPCDHLGAEDVIELAECRLRELGVPDDEWTGAQFRHGENLDGGMWASVVIEVERRSEGWIVTRLDRSREKLPDGETGLRQVG